MVENCLYDIVEEKTKVEYEYHKVWDKQTGELLEKYKVIKPKTDKI